jgi:hypothetical protein
MQYALFMENKVSRQIAINGSDFSFTHSAEDKYHNATTETTVALRGIYHQSTSYQSKTATDGSVTSSKPSPQILCLYKDGSKVSKGDEITVNDKKMFVTGMEDVQQLHVVSQISLEVIDG